MTEFADAAALTRWRDSTLRLYYAVDALMVIGIVVLTVYSIRLGPIVGPGVEQSFGAAVALMFVMGALMVHITDRAYRLWPLGRKTPTQPPGMITDETVANFLKVLVLVLAGAGVAYVLGSLIAS